MCDETLHTAHGSMDTVLIISLWHLNDLSSRIWGEEKSMQQNSS